MNRFFICLITVAAFACGSEPSDFCAQVAEDDGGCVNDNNLADCEDAETTCPGRVQIAESCPLQFSCPE